jgi:hypothetical protein
MVDLTNLNPGDIVENGYGQQLICVENNIHDQDTSKFKAMYPIKLKLKRYNKYENFLYARYTINGIYTLAKTGYDKKIDIVKIINVQECIVKDSLTTDNRRPVVDLRTDIQRRRDQAVINLKQMKIDRWKKD